MPQDKPLKAVRLILILPVLLAGVYFFNQQKSEPEQSSLHEQQMTKQSKAQSDTAQIASANSPADAKIQQAFLQQQNNVPVQGVGVVKAILADDNQGSRHQRFILSLENGQTILIAHNIDLAPRIDNLRKGDSVQFMGEYEYNPQGGVVHWTHHDPRGQHIGGWLKHLGQTYQ